MSFKLPQVVKRYMASIGLTFSKGQIRNTHNDKSIFYRDLKGKSYTDVLKQLGFSKSRGGDYYLQGHHSKVGFVKPQVFRSTLNNFITKNESYWTKYAFTIQFDWKLEKYEKIHRDKITSFVSSDSDVMKKAKLAAEDYVVKRIVTDSKYIILILNLKILSKKPVAEVDIKGLKFYGAALTYPKLGLNGSKYTGICGYELLLKNYPTRAKSIENLEAYFKKDRTEGLNSYDLYKFCSEHDISYYATDLTKRCFHKFVSNSRHFPALIITIANQHCYEITDKKRREKIVKSEASAEKCFKQEKKPKEKQNVYVNEIPKQIPKDSNVYINTDDLNEYYFNLLKNNKCYPSKWEQEKVIEIYLENSKLVALPNHQDLKKSAEILGIQYTNQTIPKLAREYFSKITENFRISTPNRRISALMDSEGAKVGAFNFVINKNYPENYKVSGIDQQKQYTSIAMKGDFYYVDANNEVCKFDQSEDIQPGCFYYVRTKNYFPFKGCGLYDYQLVQYGLDNDLITKTDIQFYFTSNEQPDILETFIETVYKTPQGKNLTNTLIGSFNIKNSKFEDANFIVDNWIEAGYYYHLTGEDTNISTLQVGQKELYRIQGYKTIERHCNNRLIYLSIVNRANMESHKMLKFVESHKNIIPIQVKTDCIYYAYNPKKGKIKIEKSDDFGAYREEKRVPEKFEKTLKETRGQVDFYSSPKWIQKEEHKADQEEYYNADNILEYNRVFVKGFAGSGKSFMINQLRQRLGNTFGYVAFTHTAANNIKGRTTHDFLKVSVDTGLFDEQYICDLSKKYKGLIIDEVNQASLSIYRALCALPKTFKIYAFGDFRQEEPVGESSYENTQMFVDLFDGNLIELKKQCRSDKEFANACIQYHDTEDFKHICKFVKCKISDKVCDINITKTNLLRKYLNKTMMIKNRNEDSELIVQHTSNSYGQDMYLYEGLPVISTKTHKSDGFVNNEMFVVEKIGEELTLRFRKLNRADDRDHTIKITKEMFARCFAPAYAITTYKIEGATIDIPYIIWEFNRMGIKSRYTALTRATDASLIRIDTAETSSASTLLPEPRWFNLDEPENDELFKLEAYECNIYKITDGKKSYIGSTGKTIKKRFNEHIEASKKGETKFYRYLRKNGSDRDAIGGQNPFEIELLEKFQARDFLHQITIEQYYIELHDTVKNGLNTKYT